MRDLAIAYGNSRQAQTWTNKTTTFDDLKARLKTPIRTTETVGEYSKMAKSARDAAKDHGGFVGGSLIGGRRKIDTVEKRSISEPQRKLHPAKAPDHQYAGSF